MIEIHCQHCKRYMGKVETLVGEIPCPNTSCKAGNQFKMINNDAAGLLNFKFLEAPKPPKEKKEVANE